MHETKVKDIIDKTQVLNLPLLEKDADIKKVFSVLTGRNHVWIVAEKGTRELVGLITESDVLGLLAPPRLPKYVFGRKYGLSIDQGTIKTASDIMRKRLFTCSPEENLGNVLFRMINNNIRRLPVMDKGNIKGEITLHFILQILLGKR